MGVNGFTAEWDPSVDALHTSMGFLPPPAFRSPVPQRQATSTSPGATASSAAAAAAATSPSEKRILTEEIVYFMNAFPKIFSGGIYKVFVKHGGLLSS